MIETILSNRNARRIPSSFARAPWSVALLCIALWIASPTSAQPIAPPSRAAHEHVITRDAWPQAANGHSVSALPAVRAVLRDFDEGGRVGVVIRHPGDDGGRRWAGEMRAWLVSLGVPSRWIELQIGAGGDQLIVGVTARR